ncbi:MAG: hypothetical protein AB7P03_08575 [Kofleriaceae bacterium]
MTKSKLLAPMFLVLTAGVAHAGGSEGSIGVGVETPIDEILGAGLSMNYDAGQFHAGGLLGFLDPGGNSDSNFALGGRFYWHLHSTAMADFGIGGQLVWISTPGPERVHAVYLQPGFQIRAFVASNVALSLAAGITIGAADADGIWLSGDYTGVAGVHYYFF